MNHKINGLFIGFIGLPGVGKTSLAKALALTINAQVFIGPREELWPINRTMPLQEKVDTIGN